MTRQYRVVRVEVSPNPYKHSKAERTRRVSLGYVDSVLDIARARLRLEIEKQYAHENRDDFDGVNSPQVSFEIEECDVSSWKVVKKR
jgi:NADPH-dependent glutamate synthase beta subunit-like oxidoreductase